MSEHTLRLRWDARKATRGGANAIRRFQRARLADLVAFARTHSPYYRELYRHLPDQVEDSSLLPVVDKRQLMAHFDDWITDREITLDRVRAFVSDPGRVGTATSRSHVVR